MEEVKVPFPMGTLNFQSERIKPFFHSRVMCAPRDPYKAYPGFAWAMCQFHQDGEQVMLVAPDWSLAAPYAHPEKYKTPAELRKEAGWPGY